MSSIGARVRELRAKSGLSQPRFASLAGIDPTSLARIERGETPDPGYEVLRKIAAAAGLQIDFFDPTAAESPSSDSAWSKAVDAYLQTSQGATTPAPIAAKLARARHSHLVGDLMIAVHDLRRELQAAESAPDLTNSHPAIDVPAKKTKKA